MNIIAHLNIIFLKNKFDSFIGQITSDTDILIVSETQLDESFQVGQFVFEDFEVPYGVDQNYNDRVIISIVREDIPSKLHSIVSSVVFFLGDKSKKKEMVTQLFFQST